MLTISDLHVLRPVLARLDVSVDGPRCDAGWLMRRCDDTLLARGAYQLASHKQLERDVAEFDSEFPGMLPAAIVDDARAPSTGDSE